MIMIENGMKKYTLLFFLMLTFVRKVSSSDSALAPRPPRPRPLPVFFLTTLALGLAMGITTGLDLPLAVLLSTQIINK